MLTQTQMSHLVLTLATDVTSIYLRNLLYLALCLVLLRELTFLFLHLPVCLTSTGFHSPLPCQCAEKRKRKRDARILFPRFKTVRLRQFDPRHTVCRVPVAISRSVAVCKITAKQCFITAIPHNVAQLGDKAVPLFHMTNNC